jgi:predicted RNA-binding protein associated with RNAse of E/G family
VSDQSVHIDFRKWDGARHWQFDMHRLGQDEHGLWLWSPPGSPMQRGHEPVKHSKSVNVKVIPEGRWWTAVWSWQRRHDLYIDIITPPQWNGATVTMVDIDLDVIRWADGSVEVLDEDEFAEHQIKFDYPERLVDTARAVTAKLVLALEAGHEPFGSVADSWMMKAIRLAETSNA